MIYTMDLWRSMKLLLQRSSRERTAVVNKLLEQVFMLHVFFNLGNKNDC